MVTVTQTPFGVPVIVNEDMAIPLTGEYVGWIQNLCLENPLLLLELEEDVKFAVASVTFNIDPDQDMQEWRVDFGNAMTVNYFGPAVSVLAQVRHQIEALEATNG